MKRPLSRQPWLVFLSVFFAAALPSAHAGDSNSKPQVLAPGYGELFYNAPQPGTYALPVIGTAGDGVVISSADKQLTLHELMGDKIVLLSFIYSTCSDVNGCPLATSVFHKIKRRLKKEPELAEKIRLLTLSFDPENDTPDKMRQYAQGFNAAGVDWKFLTTASEQALKPILERYQQNIQKNYDDRGNFLGTYSHLLRVYLIDRDKQLRNIYSVSFLHPDTLINDIKTLLSSPPPSIIAAHISTKSAPQSLYRGGDNKNGYDQQGYTTHSISLNERVGENIDLLNFVQIPPLGLPAVPIPAANPITRDKIRLGRKLFYDRRLSLNNTFSCAMCHIPEQGFTSNEMKAAVGIEGRTVRRNTPTLYNIAYSPALFHDSRESSLENQVWGPLLAGNEMGNPSIGFVVDKINNSADYAGLFVQTFGRGPSMETIGMALASYQRTLNSANSLFDRWYYGKQQQALTASAQKGFGLFTGKAGCSACHTITKEFALFTDNQLHNTGVGYAESMQITPPKQRVQVAPGVFVEVDSSIIADIAEPIANDLGRYEISQRPEDRWKYRTPTLRNINLTAPYMHNGSLPTLTEVIEFYNQGGIKNENLDPLLKPLNLTEQEKKQLLSFLNSLTGENVNQLVSDAFSAPLGDAK